MKCLEFKATGSNLAMSSQMPTAEGTRDCQRTWCFNFHFTVHRRNHRRRRSSFYVSSSASLIPIEFSGPQLARAENGSTNWKMVQQNCPSNENTRHLQIQLDLQVPVASNATDTNFYADLRLSFLKSFIKDQRFQMSVQGLGTATWQLQGRVMLKADVRLRTARQRIRDILLKWHGRLGLSADAGHAFKKLLESKLVVKSLAHDEPFAGDSHWWTPESPPLVGSVPYASAAAFFGPRTVDAAGPPAAPTWAFNRPHSCDKFTK